MMAESLIASAPAPFLVSWNLTRLCNLACGHCYLDAVQRKHQAGDELATDEASEVIRQLAALFPGAMVVLSGGEPLMRPDLPRLVEAAAASGLFPVIGTNGTMLCERRAAELREAGAMGVGISVDSASPAFHDRLRGVPGAWRGAQRGARAARSAGMALLLQATLFEENRGDLVALADLAESLGAAALNFFFLVCTGRGAQQTDLTPAAYEDTLARIVQLQRERPGLIVRARCAPYLRRLLGLHAGEGASGYAEWSSACLAGRSYFRITPQGQVTPCPYIPEIAGDLRTTPLATIWNEHPVLIRLRNELPGGKCGVCDFRYSCGGCRARALARHGELLAEDPNCLYVRPPAARPELPPAPPARRQVNWEPEARALLERIPAFVRGRVKARLEEAAAREGQDCITRDFMRERRPPFGFFGRTTTRFPQPEAVTDGRIAKGSKR